MRDGSQSDPDALRRWWWRVSQRTRVAVVCTGTLLAVVVAGVALAGVGRAPASAVARPPIPTMTPTASSSTDVGQTSDTPEARPAPDRVIAVIGVPSANLLDGVDTLTNRPVAVRVSGIRATPPCWADQARLHAVELVLGKQVRLAGDERPGAHQPDPDGRVPARVLLADGHDYAHTVLASGAAQVDISLGTAPNQQDLAAVEADARQARRGVWGPPCVPNPTSSPPPTNQQGPPPPPTQLPPPPTQLPPPPTHRPPPVPPTTPPPQDGVQHGVRKGDRCSPEGARGVTVEGEHVVCRDRDGRQPRWRRA
ncbi:nuclease-like protein [Herbihabitans rhizosphaerae]|uniref:Nuclease-like protein n=1 Tax=Herbihabitans rhizosphaerae TaxID=1872711 RepID=A0A4Q7KDS5_9PSEU|nr:thermonuclease family protein [Herbihabitans rhizosphaerae]RZS32191.1 nuclease-like protein [Herbihabitans rhizosphaerae]